jgi:alpha,alpha-trehalose-phosphate synthase [UDP-forming]
MWNKESLHKLIQSKLSNYNLIVVANREPYIHRHVDEEIECQRPASGMASALDPIMRACGGTWVGHGGGDADRETVDERDRVRVPPEDPTYTLRRVWLSKKEEEGYYHGLSNEGLWPLCHVVFTRPVFELKHWEMYKKVNKKFADAVIEEAGDVPTFVFIQDYHFALMPRMLKQMNPNLIVAQFWHIPWPNRETFQAFPWKEELLDGLLGNDLLGFHLRYHCQNFLDTVDRGIEAMVNQEQSEVTRGGKTTLVRPFPISIDFESHEKRAKSAEVDDKIRKFNRYFKPGKRLVGVGIERIDYTKGIPERLRAVDRMLEKNPEYVDKFIFIQVGVPSRGHIDAYKKIDDEIDRIVEEVNWKWGTETWKPIHYAKRHFSTEEMMALHRMAHFFIVSSLHDGMNLVSKEYVASRFDGDGMLILSSFAGASRELSDAILVNPFSIDELAEAIRQAIETPEEERRKRMQKLRAAVAENNIYRWAGKIISALLKFDFPESM